jgi:hypothetical protein
MGYAIYWKQIRPVSQDLWDTFVQRALKLVKRRRTGTIELENRYSNQKNVLYFRGAPESGEAFYVSKDKDPHAQEGSFCKTNRLPYTMDVYICLILMFDMGMIEEISSDDMRVMFPEALAYVKEHYALKQSYAKLEKMGNRYNNNNNDDEPISPVKQQKSRKAAAAARAAAAAVAAIMRPITPKVKPPKKKKATTRKL